MPDGPFLEVRGLSKTYRIGGKEVTALKDVSFELGAGRSLSVTGYSGSGKSTLLGLIGGLDRPTSGDVAVGRVSYRTLSEDGLTGLRRTKIGFVFQTFNLFPALSAYENVYLSARVAGMPKTAARERSRELLGVVGMGERLNHKPSQLSGGEQQRVAVARALVFGPSLLLADEPTGDLDSRNGEVVADLIFRLCGDHGSSCVFATHNLELAARADETMALRDGSVEDRGVGGAG